MLITITDDMTARRGPNKPSAPQLTQAMGEKRLKILRLIRPSNGSYGFHLRGGREHGTGFFISHVEPGTEAFSQGLRTGDQVLRVNDLTVNGALHKEVASLVRSGNQVVLHVKSTGLIPVKNNPDDPLSWVLVEPGSDVSDPLADRSEDFPSKYTTGSISSSTGTSTAGGYGTPIQIVVGGAGKHTIGCSICKGPPEKPGIFVQRVRERGIAEEAGLRPGDQILSCNGISFHQADFQQAVQAMKSSPYLRLEVLRGAGLELVMGESSGYNSSASSETGEELYSPSETDSRDGFSRPYASSTLTRLNGIRGDHIQLDSNRDWKDIEAEWADAEVNEKRSQLHSNHTLLSRKLTQQTPLSKSFLNLTINEADEEPGNRQISRNTCNTCSHMTQGPPPTQNKRSTLSKPRSMTDLRHAHKDANYKIALQMASDEHVSKIVIPSAPKNQQHALLRLEELSSGVKSSTLLHSKSPSCATLQNHSKTCSISSTSSEDSNLQGLYPDRARPGLSASLKETRQLLRCRSNPQDSTGVSSEDSDSLLSFPSSTISICQSGSGRYTSKVHIRSPPPPPPPRGNGTKLTRQHRKLKCGHHRKLNVTEHTHSPPTSPCTSSTSSGADHQHHNAITFSGGFRRRQSLESLSASSDDSAHWDEADRRQTRVIVNAVTNSDSSSLASTTVSAASAAPPPPPPPPAPFNSCSTSNIPPPPPPPPVQMSSSEGSSFCSQILSRQQEINGAASKLKSLDERPAPLTKKPIIDPKKMQHEKLMEEFKKAHAMMVAKRQANASEPIS